MLLGMTWTASLLVGAVLAVLAYWRHWHWSNRRLLELAKKLPGPPTLPIVGNALVFLSNPEEQLAKITSMIQKYGEYVRFWLGPDLNIIVANPADIKYLLTSAKVNQKGPVYDSLVTYIGRGILTGGPQWRHFRKVATPSYNKKIVQNFSDIFNKEIKEFVEIIKTKDPNKTYNIFFDVRECTTQCVCQTLMGLSKEDSLNVKKLHEIVYATQGFYRAIFRQITCWWLQIPLVSWLTGDKRQEIANVKLIDEVMEDILAKRRRAIAKDGFPSEERMGVVDRFILDGMTDYYIKLESFSLFTTSQEAAAKITSAVILFLAHLPDWQEKVYNEIIEVTGDNDDEVSEEAIKRLQYLDMVYKEALRYLAIAALIQRKVEEEVTINDGKITIPAGTSLAIPLHVLHRDPKYWDEPNRVMPERFLPENVKKRDPNAFIPFSLGPMDCLGRVYATALIKNLIVQLVKAVQFEADGKLEDLDIDVAISVKFTKGYNLRSRPRKATTNGTSNGKVATNGRVATNGKVATNGYVATNGKIAHK